jgi:hypothetical protein
MNATGDKFRVAETLQETIDEAVPETRTITASTGLTGGGDLTADRSFAVAYGPVSGLVVGGANVDGTAAAAAKADHKHALPPFGTTAGTFAEGSDTRIANAVPNTRTITAGTGLTGGGDLTADRTLTVAYGTAAGTALQGNQAAGGDASGPLDALTVTQARGLKTATTTVVVAAAAAPTAGQVLTAQSNIAASWQSPAAPGTGDVVGPVSAADNLVATFGGATGKLIKSTTTPDIGTPASGTLTSCTGLPISTGVAGLGAGVAAFLATPTSANLAAAVTDESGSGALVFATSTAITAHRSRHEDGGADEISVTGLSGLLADPQTAISHKISHQDNGADEINVTGLSGVLGDPQVAGSIKTATTTVVVSAAAAPTSGQVLTASSSTAAAWASPGAGAAHNTTHQDGGGDELSVTGLSGLLADPQTPKTHATSHQSGGGDVLNVTNLSGLLADPQTAGGLKTATTTVAIASAVAPTAGQVLAATSGTTAAWSTPTPLTGTAPTQVSVTTAAVGVATAAARGDHVHSVSANIAPTALSFGVTNTVGGSSALARADHVHAIPAAAAPAALAIGLVQSGGVAATLNRSDHVHAMPGLVTTGVDGFMAAADKTKLDGIVFGSAAGTYCEGNDARLVAAATNPAINGFRLAPTADDSIPADGTFSTVYLAPVEGDMIALYTGSLWALRQASSVSYTLAGRTADLPFDLFAYWTGSAVALEVVNWASGTARTTALVRQNGVWTKSGDATRRYLGTVRPRSATTYRVQRSNNIDVGSAGIDYWNVANQRTASVTLLTTANLYAYASVSRQVFGSANSQIEVVQGLADRPVEARAFMYINNNGNLAVAGTGIGVNDTAAVHPLCVRQVAVAVAVANANAPCSAVLSLQAGLGVARYTWLEAGDPNSNFFGRTTSPLALPGITLSCWY